MNVDIGIVHAQFPENENINGIFVAVWRQDFSPFMQKNLTWGPLTWVMDRTSGQPQVKLTTGYNPSQRDERQMYTILYD